MKKFILSTLFCIGLAHVSMAQLNKSQVDEIFRAAGVTPGQMKEVVFVNTSFIRAKKVVKSGYSQYKAPTAKMKITQGGILVIQSAGGKPGFVHFVSFNSVKSIEISAKFKWARIGVID